MLEVVTKSDFKELRKTVEELVEAIKELFQARKCTEERMQIVFKRLSDQIYALGSRGHIRKSNT